MSDPTSAPLSRAADAAQAPTYRPLSLLALIGVAVAGLYAAIVIVGGLGAFFGGDPLPMARFNAGQMSRTGGGAFTAFAQTPFVRLLSLGGNETKIDFAGVDKWGYVNGGYQVRLLYNVETPQISFVMEVPVQSREGKGSAG